MRKEVDLFRSEGKRFSVIIYSTLSGSIFRVILYGVIFTKRSTKLNGIIILYESFLCKKATIPLLFIEKTRTNVSVLLIRYKHNFSHKFITFSMSGAVAEPLKHFGLISLINNCITVMLGKL